ncbi:MAG: hypothetical protein ACI30A_07380 [Paludibacteraceae bacterium]
MRPIVMCFLTACVAVSVTSCSLFRKATPAQPQVQTINLALAGEPQADKFANLEYGIRLNIQDDRADKRIIQVYDASVTTSPVVNVNPEVTPFISESMRRYMRTMGFNLDADVATDYLMQVAIKEFHADWLSGIGWSGTVVLEVKIFDHNHALVYPSTEIAGRANVYGSAQSILMAQQVLNQAYANALADIDWDRVAYFLHRSNDPKQEANKKVTGEGNTALEHLAIHWNVNSRPQGADVYWRVISQTPEVKNQNYKYLETTPYESSETINIKGLTYNNAGNVQIEIKVEKAGYYSQTRKIDVLSLIDDNDVSYMFKLVPEE